VSHILAKPPENLRDVLWPDCATDQNGERSAQLMNIRSVSCRSRVICRQAAQRFS
jgi:hypothetical protein